MDLKEVLCRSELNEKQICELKQKLSCVENQLNASELHAQELIVNLLFYFFKLILNYFQGSCRTLGDGTQRTRYLHRLYYSTNAE